MNANTVEILKSIDPVVFMREELRMTPDPWQEHVLRYSGKRLRLFLR